MKIKTTVVGANFREILLAILRLLFILKVEGDTYSLLRLSSISLLSVSSRFACRLRRSSRRLSSSCRLFCRLISS